jgi:hypothetical protein
MNIDNQRAAADNINRAIVGHSTGRFANFTSFIPVAPRTAMRAVCYVFSSTAGS